MDGLDQGSVAGARHLLLDDLVHTAIDRVAIRTPNAVAVACGADTISYRRLRRRANALARRLQSLYVGPDVIVGICLDRSIDMVAAILAVMRAGGAYAPLDPAYPTDRLDFMMADADARVLVTTSARRDRWPHSRAAVICVDEPGAYAGEEDVDADAAPSSAVGPDHLAYVIYTSGSTGRPKGVMVTHRNLAYSTRARLEYYKARVDGYLLLSSFAFDSSVAGLFWTLCSGGRLILPADGVERDPARLAGTIRQQRVSHLLALPSLYRLILPHLSVDTTRLQGGALSTVVVAGEACPTSLAREHARALRGVSLFNEYGPTEATVWCTVHEVLREPDGARVPIGRPIPGARCYIVREDGRLASDGEAGELYVGGPGVTRGYLKRQDLTDARFVPDTFRSRPSATSRPSAPTADPSRGTDAGNERGGGASPDARLYCTGDLVRRLADGAIDFLGRVDHQAKIRGYRIELGEIEAVLGQHPDVREAVVIAREDTPGEPRLVAYVVPRSTAAAPTTAPTIADLRAFLGERLPDFMVPAAFVTMEAMPLSANGKVDRAALSAPGTGRPDLQQAYVAPRTALERWLAQTWAEILQLDAVGIHDRFFELGGSSLQAAQIVDRLQSTLGEFVFIVVIFECPTVAELAGRLRDRYANAVERVFGEAASPAALRGAARREDARVDDAMLARARALVPVLRGRAQRPPTKNPSALFILSPPRSGTTLLTAMLAGHPRLFAASELNLLGFNTLAERHATYHGKLSLWLEGAIRVLMEIHGIGADDAFARMALAEARGMSVQEFFGELQRAIAPRLLLDKSPAYGLDAATLRRAEEDFERPLYIHLTRHPYAMIRSFADNHMDQVYFNQHAFTPRQAGELVWVMTHRTVDAFLREMPTDRHVHLRYEDLVAAPEETMRRLCRTLGLEFHADLLDPYKDKDRKILGGVHKQSKSMGDPKFHTFDGIVRAPAEAGPGIARDNFLGEPTRALAAALGYELPHASAPASRPSPIVARAPAPGAARARQTRDLLQQRRLRRQAVTVTMTETETDTDTVS